MSLILLMDTPSPAPLWRRHLHTEALVQWCPVSVKALLSDYSDFYPFVFIQSIPDGQYKKEIVSIWTSSFLKVHDNSSFNHFHTWSLLSAIHLILAVIFSMACSRATVAEPKPTSEWSSLNRFNCGRGKDKRRTWMCAKGRVQRSVSHCYLL